VCEYPQANDDVLIYPVHLPHFIYPSFPPSLSLALIFSSLCVPFPQLFIRLHTQTNQTTYGSQLLFSSNYCSCFPVLIVGLAFYPILSFCNTGDNVTSGKTFTRRLLLSLRWEFFWQFTWAMPWCVMTTASPYCLNKIIQYIECEDCGPPTSSEYIWVFALLGASIVESLCFQTALHYGRRIFVHTTSICNAAVFAKALKRKDMASPVGKADEEKEEGENKKDDENKKKDGSANISSRFCFFQQLFIRFISLSTPQFLIRLPLFVYELK
jgi:hypothetical protein